MRCAALLALGLAAAGALAPARAGVFDDDEARKRILAVEAEMRAKASASDARIAELENRLKNLGLLDLIRQLEDLKGEVSALRGQIEVLANQIEVTQKKQKDFYLDLDSRLRRLEEPTGKAGAAPAAGGAGAGATPAAPVDAKAAARQAAAEKKAYDAASASFRKGNYPAAITGFRDFLDTYPGSANAPSAQYWLGLAYHNLRDTKNAVAAQQALIKMYPDSPKVPDALLAIATAQGDSGDSASARNTLEDIIARYPNSEAAQKARTRLATAGR